MRRVTEQVGRGGIAQPRRGFAPERRRVGGKTALARKAGSRWEEPS
jgi:hypothetical protein